MTTMSWDMLSFDQGTAAVVSCGELIIRVCFERSPDDAMAVILGLYPTAKRESQPSIRKGLRQLSEYFQGTRRKFTLEFDNSSLTPFARDVQQELCKVPFGEIVTYGALASRVGFPKAARAVGRIMATNPFPLLVPCHRVVNADGSIGQYSAAYGTASKSWLISFERDVAGYRQSGPLAVFKS